MKFVAAYLLAVLAGNSSPSAEDLTAILESGIFTQLQHIQLTALVTIPSISNYSFIIWNGWVPNINPLAGFVEKTQFCQ
jgi:hypothetical protein